jgi:hypothetical protein
MNKAQLLERAQELEIQVPERATNAEITNLIKVAEHPILKAELQSLADSTANISDKLKLAESDRDRLVAENTALVEERDANAAALSVALNEIKELKSKDVKDSNVEVAVYENKDGEYPILVNSFHFQGIKYASKDAVKNPELMERLISSGFVKLKK